MADIAKDVLKHSVQEDEITLTEGVGTAWFSMITLPELQGQLPEWGQPLRQLRLRQLYYNDMNSLVTSAIQQLVRRIKQTPWTLVGGPTLTRQYQSLMQESEFGDGFDTLMSKLLVDYYTLDCGAFLEIVGPGQPHTPLRGKPVGLVALDALRCYVTGNRTWPVFYRSHRTNKLHKLHWTRVQRLVDMPTPDPFYRGLGLCALSRASTVAQAQILLMRHEIENLADQPANGIITFAGVAREKLLSALGNYNDSRENNTQPILRNLLQLTSTDPANPVKVEVTPFSNLPEGYTQDEVIRNHVNLLALALGVDPQDLWPLASKSMGSGLQSEVLHAKGQGKAYGDTLSLLTRVFNISVLPKSLELRFKPRDGEREQQDADTATSWMGVATTGVNAGLFTPMQGALLLASNVDAFSDVLLDEAGNLRVADDDVREPGQESQKKPTPNADAAANVLGETKTPPKQEGDEPDKARVDDDTTSKSIENIQVGFERRVKPLLTMETTKLRFTALMAHYVAHYGEQAFKAGLMAGGVQSHDMSVTDEKSVLQLTKAQSVYASHLADALFSSKSVSTALGNQRPGDLFQRLIEPFYRMGQQSADQNGYYRWLDKSLSVHVHRLQDWLDAGYAGKFEKVEGPSVGFLPMRDGVE